MTTANMQLDTNVVPFPLLEKMASLAPKATEALKCNMTEIWEFDSAKWEPVELNESEKSVDGQIFLSKVRGPLFVPDGMSRNKRFYPKNLWENVLKDKKVVSRLEERTMWGTIGHFTRVVNEEDLRNGVVSHIVTKLWIDEKSKLGMGEILVLNTPSGQNLNTYLRAGCKLKASSRASGSFKEGLQQGGAPVVDPTTYLFETFDFVIEPGFTQAIPSLVESLNMEKGNDMDLNAIVKDLNESRENLQSDLRTTNDQLRVVQEENLQLRAQNDKLNESYGRLSVLEDLGIDGRSAERLGNVITKLKFADMSAFLGFLESVNPADKELITKGEVQATNEECEEYRKIGGTPEEIQESLNKAIEQLSEYNEIGTADEIRETILRASHVLENYLTIGTPSKIKASIDHAVSVLEQYQEIGTPEEIQESLAKFQNYLTKHIQESRNVKSAQLAKKYGLEMEDIMEMATDMGGDMKKVEAHLVKILPSLKNQAQPLSEKWDEISYKAKEPACARLMRSL